MSNNEKITVYDVIGACTDEGQWVNGEFEAIVTNASVGQGKKPSTADLCDPHSPGIKIKASWFGGGNFLQFAGCLCLFGGQGMKAKIYNGNKDLQMSAKTLVNVLQAAAAPATPAQQPAPRTAAGADRPPATASANRAPLMKKEDAETHFHRTMQRIALLYLHSDQYVTDMELKRGIIFPPDQRQSAVASMFITAKDKGLLDSLPALRAKDEKGFPIRYTAPVKNVDPEAAAKAAAEAAKIAAEKAAEEARIAAQNSEDDQVPF